MDAYSINRDQTEAKHEKQHQQRMQESKSAANPPQVQTQYDQLKAQHPQLFSKNASSSAVSSGVEMTKLKPTGKALNLKSTAATNSQMDWDPFTRKLVKANPPVQNGTWRRRKAVDLTADREKVLEGIHKVQKVVDSMKRIPSAVVIGATGSGLVLSIIVYALKAPLAEEDTAVSEVRLTDFMPAAKAHSFFVSR
jgi:hypothetical protein